ncbi:MAG: NAD(P)/FAD-dependent oxidoreductase [Holosporales bacterium]|jgi:predicted NAD/FAD-binding protein
MQKIAVVGSGIAGMAAARLLAARYAITLYEKNTALGGHTRTRIVDYNGCVIPVDTGFIVFNPVNYPELVGLFRYLGVATHKSSMTFGFTTNNGGFEWGARNINAVFGQRSNLFRPSFYAMAFDVWRFFKKAEAMAEGLPDASLGDLLKALRLGDFVRDGFILPMGAAIWSCSAQTMLEFPAQTFVQFFRNHGLLSFGGQHQWYTVTGGAQQYVEKILAPLEGHIRLNAPVMRVYLEADKVVIQTKDGAVNRYDQVVLACHADEALAMLGDATPNERSVLGAFSYQENQAFLHCDAAVMPKRKACWSSWNYASSEAAKNVSVTYWMNELQGIDNAYPLFVTLNPMNPISEAHIFDRHTFHHPVFTREALAAQAKIPSIQGQRGLWFAGAYQRYGFHEDGLVSAIRVAQGLGVSIPWH